MTDQQLSAQTTATGLMELATLFLLAEDVEEALGHLARTAVVVVPDGPSCGITVDAGGTFTTVVYAGSIPDSVDKAQYERNDGPCLEALRTGRTVIVQDLAAEDKARWSGFPAVALAEGAHGVLAHPLLEADGQVIGVLNMYAHEADLFPQPALGIARQFVEPAALLLGGVLKRLSADQLIAQLHEAMAYRAVIDQAIGIIVSRRQCAPDAALAALRKISNDRNIKLRDVAAGVVEAASAGRAIPFEL